MPAESKANKEDKSETEQKVQLLYKSMFYFVIVSLNEKNSSFVLLSLESEDVYEP